MMTSVSNINRLTDSVRNIDRIMGGSAMLGSNISRMMESSSMTKLVGLDKLRATTKMGFLSEANKGNFDKIIGGLPMLGSAISKMMESSGLTKIAELDRFRAMTGIGFLDKVAKNHRMFDVTTGVSEFLRNFTNNVRIIYGR